MDDQQRRDEGMRIRREVLGDAHVDRASGNASDETRDFQDYITRTAWGEIWTRDVLPRRERSILTLGILTALGRDGELKLHIKAAQNNGLTRKEIAEVFMHSAVYAGVPAANHALSILQADDTAD